MIYRIEERIRKAKMDKGTLIRELVSKLGVAEVGDKKDNARRQEYGEVENHLIFI